MEIIVAVLAILATTVAAVAVGYAVRVSGAHREASVDAVMPLRDQLDRVEAQIRQTEAARREADGSLLTEVRQVQQASTLLGTQTAALVTALRKPQARGRWGEMQLQRIVEVAGMVERCDFDTQVSTIGEEGTLRPDMVINLAGGRHIVLDSKVTLSAFLEAHEAVDEDVREERLLAHARHLRSHVKQLSAKEYWRQFDQSPEFVVLFVPGEAFLAPALERMPSLLEEAAADKIVIATPTTLIALLRTVAYSWQQVALADNAKAIYEAGRDLYKGLGIAGGKIDQLGRSLTKSVESYNAMIGSLERTVLPKARRMHELKVSEDPAPALDVITEQARPLVAPEWCAPETGLRVVEG